MSNREEEYLRAILSVDGKGLDSIYKDFLPRIKKLITSRGGSEEDALDVFQDALIVIYEKVQEGNFKLNSKFYTLLYGICRNLWGNRLQKKSFQEVTLDDNAKYIEDEDWSEAMYRSEQFAIFWSNFRKLGEDCQQILKMFFDKIKMTEIQEKLGHSSTSYTKKRKFQCKEKLIKLIRNDPNFIDFIDES